MILFLYYYLCAKIFSFLLKRFTIFTISNFILKSIGQEKMSLKKIIAPNGLKVLKMN
ncbi:hypothetical protein C8P67_101308 [Flavobacterium aquicola]|uniref:Uncharacterized protein n=1 Tax=Flavobacterium aquicola TaxID=1682742 RepID=A0A3E0EVH1_9FLAO|nr:hypothetical protein C8P67_101308 [Flavobacterium aquicola]